jgi:hypothetical protein
MKMLPATPRATQGVAGSIFPPFVSVSFVPSL